jgi:dienelactone hydrolase
MLARHGYGVLVFDRRGEGESQGEYNAFGWGGERDLLAALDYLQGRPDVDARRIGGLGLSVGGELLLQTAAETAALRAVVSEGAGHRSIREQLSIDSVGNWLMLPNYAFTTGATALFANQGPPPNLKELVGRIAPRPVFLIHAVHGAGSEEHLNPIYAKAAGAATTVWAIPDAGHTGRLDARPREYEERVIAFFDAALLGHA